MPTIPLFQGWGVLLRFRLEVDSGGVRFGSRFRIQAGFWGFRGLGFRGLGV